VDFRCLPESMCAQHSGTPKDCRARPFTVNQRGLGSPVRRRWSSYLPPVQNLTGFGGRSRSLWSAANSLSISYLEDGIGASLKPFRGLHRVIPSAPVPEPSGLGTPRYVPPSSSTPASFLRSAARHSRPIGELARQPGMRAKPICQLAVVCA
jgi:hypothetical protein